MITIDEVESLVRRQMRGKKLAAVAISEDSELRDLGLSSLQIAEVVFSLEEAYDIEFDPARAANARTLGDLIAVGNAAVTDRGSVPEGQTGGRA